MAAAQQGFYKVFQEKDYHSISDIIAIDQNHFAFITSDFFYRIDGSGNILLKKELKQGTSSFPESLIRDAEGNFWIAFIIFDSQSRPSKVLQKITQNGQVLKVVDFGVSVSVENMKLIPSAANTFFLSYQDRSQSGNSAIRALLLDNMGNTIWEKQVTDTIYHRYTIKKGVNNTVDIFFERMSDRQRQISTIDASGNISERSVNLVDPANSNYYVNDFVRTNEGFVFCGAENKAFPLLPDGLICKADNNGNIVWEKTLNIKLSDNFYRIEAVADGYIILSMSGYKNLTSDAEGDIIMIKTDKQGNKLWTKAFGGARMDYARFMRILDQNIVFAGQSSYPGTNTSIPFVCKTDMNGELPSVTPFEPVAAVKMKPLETQVQQYSSELIQSAQGSNASVLSGGNFLSTEDDQIYPFITHNDQHGNSLWYKQLSVYPAQLRVLKQIRQNEYIAVAEIEDIFANIYDVYKLDETGKISWTRQVRANAIHDVIATRDGGLILTGTSDISFINYETILIKLDASGDEQWNKTIGELRLWETGRKIIETPEQDFLIVGNVQTEFDILSSVYLLKIDRQGNKIWAKTFSDGITTDIGYDIIRTIDQGYLIAGTSNKQPFTNKDLLLIKTDKNGSQSWRKKYDLHLMDEGFQLMNSADGGFLILGTTAEPQAGALEKYIYVMKTDAEGRNTGMNYYGKKSLQTMHPSMTVLSTGDTIITGTTQDEYGKESMFLIPLESILSGSLPEHLAMSLYPNPSNGSSTLVMNTAEMGDVAISIYDRGGRLVKHLIRTKTAVSFKEDLSLLSLSAGTYFINIRFNGKRDNIKWLIVR
jgi:hypothetical protein